MLKYKKYPPPPPHLDIVDKSIQGNICSKSTIETLEKRMRYVQQQKKAERRHAFVNFKHISHLFLKFILLTWKSKY